MDKRHSLLASLALLGLLIWLPAGCGGGQPAVESHESIYASPAPGEENSDRYCLWLLWSRDRALIEEAGTQAHSGRPFMLAAREINLRQATQTSLNADCLPSSGLDPAILAAVKDLGLGEVSQPFALRGGMAMAMRTTDRYRRRGQSLFEQRKYPEAEKMLLEDLRLHPASAPTWHLVAMIRAASGDREGALRAFDQALAFAPRDAAIMNDKASTLNELGRTAEAGELYERALAIDTGSATVKANLAWALMQEGRQLDRAEGLALEAAQAEPDKSAMWNTLGRVQQARGENAKAAVSFYRAARLDPLGGQARERLLATLLALSPETVARLAGPDAGPAPLKTASHAPAPMPKPFSPAAGPSPLAPQTSQVSQVSQTPQVPQVAQTPQAKPAPAQEGDQGEILRVYQPEPVVINRPWTTAAPVTPSGQTPKAAQAPQAAQAAPGFYLQVSSYFVADLARKEAEAWQRRGQPARMESWTGQGKTWYRVLLGPYPSQEQAQSAGQSFKARRLVASFFVVEF